MNFRIGLGIILAIVSGYATSGAAKQPRQGIIHINEELQIRQITPNVYMYTEWADMGKWGRVGCNGLVVTNGGPLPMDGKYPGVKIQGFVPGHWHADCVGGLEWLNRKGIRTYAGERTNKILVQKGLPVARQTFADSLVIRLGKTRIECYYPGGGHATDNIIVWIPTEKVLFGGCMIKDTAVTNTGNTSGAAPLPEWLQTVEKTEARFPRAGIIVPGHGEPGGKELFQHTKEILQTNELKIF